MYSARQACVAYGRVVVLVDIFQFLSVVAAVLGGTKFWLCLH